jgi:hypothetical protein
VRNNAVVDFESLTVADLFGLALDARRRAADALVTEHPLYRDLVSATEWRVQSATALYLDGE